MSRAKTEAEMRAAFDEMHEKVRRIKERANGHQQMDAARRRMQERYDQAHPGEARMRRLVNTRIVEPERSRLLARAHMATEFVWWQSPQKVWVRCPVVHVDADVVVVIFNKEPIYLSAHVLSRSSLSHGIGVSGIFSGFFYNDARKKQAEELDAKLRNLHNGTFSHTTSGSYVSINGQRIDFSTFNFFVGPSAGARPRDWPRPPPTPTVPPAPACLVALGLSAKATERDVKQAFGKLALKAHPDHGGDAAKFRTLYEHYQAALAAVRRTP